eukprot:gene44961-55962_t
MIDLAETGSVVVVENAGVVNNNNAGVMVDGSLESLTKSIKHNERLVQRFPIHVQYRGLTFWSMAPEKTIHTVGSVFLSLFGIGVTKKHRVDIVSDLTGRILPERMTLVMGPPGCGKTTFLKALSGQLNVSGANLEGDILFNGDLTKSGKYVVGK